jgi:hypothetical protein
MCVHRRHERRVKNTSFHKRKSLESQRIFDLGASIVEQYFLHTGTRSTKEEIRGDDSPKIKEVHIITFGSRRRCFTPLLTLISVPASLYSA